MKTYTFILLVLLSLSGLSQETDYLKVPQIQTKATFTTEVSPDKITLSIMLSEGNTKGKVSVEELERKMEGVLKQNSVDVQKQLTLMDLSSNFKDYFLKKTDVQKTKNYLLEVYDAKTAGNVIKGLEGNNISNVQLVKTEYIKIEDLKIEMKGNAVLKAKRQAEEMVKGLNQKLGSVIFISDMETNYGYLSGQISGLNIRGANSVGYDEESLDVAFDKIRVEATVTVYFRIEE